MEEYPLPKDWKFVRLGEVCKKPEYGYTASAEYKEVGPRLLRITDIQNGKVDWGKVPYCKCINEFNKYLLKSGDILFARTGGTTGKSYIIYETPKNTIFASYLIRVRTGNYLIPEYLYQFLQSEIYWNQVNNNKRGGAQPNMNASLLSNIILPLPPISEQKYIIAKIKELIQEVERARTACEKQLEAAKALHSAYLREVFESEEAKKWERKKLSEVIKEVMPGFACGKRAGPEGFIQLRMNNISNNGYLDLSSVLRIPATKKQIEKYQLLLGDVIFNNTNSVELVGKTTLFDKNDGVFLYSNHLTRLRPIPQILDSDFLTFWLQLQWYLRVFEKLCNRWIGQAAVQREKLLNLKAPFPPFQEQKLISNKLKEKIAEVNKLRVVSEEQLKTINTLPKAILKKAFNGEL